LFHKRRKGLLLVPPTITSVPPKLSLFPALPILKNKGRKRKNSKNEVLPHCTPELLAPRQESSALHP